MNPDIQAVSSSIEYKFILLRKIVAELKSRQGYLYSTYKPAGPKHAEFHRDTNKIKQIVGANRGAKTTTVFQEMLLLIQGEHPFIDDIPVPSRWWIVAAVFEKVHETGGLWDKLMAMIPPGLIKSETYNVKQGNFKIKFHNGSEITFKAQTQGVKAFTTVSLHGVIIDERITNMDIRNQIRMRILDTYGRMLYTNDSLEDDDWQQELLDKGLASLYKVETRDNKTIPVESIDAAEAELDEDNRQRLLYGNRVTRNAIRVFPDEMFTDYNYEPIAPSNFTINIRETKLIHDENGKLEVYRDKIPGMKYLIGVDIAEGVGQDYTVAHVMTSFGEQTATWSDNYTRTDKAVDEHLALARYYNDALIIPENQGVAGGSYMSEARKKMGRHLYYERNKNNKLGGYGVRTEQNIKLEMINLFILALQNNETVIHSKQLWEELRHFVRILNPNTGRIRYAGEKKWHDDRVMACLLAFRPFSQEAWKRQYIEDDYEVEDKDSEKYFWT